MSKARVATLAANRRTKQSQIDVCLRFQVEYTTRTTGLEKVDLPYEAMPDSSLDGVSMVARILGKPLTAPFLIGAMTGGARRSARINRNLAQAAEALGVGMMLGSQRVMLDDERKSDGFLVRDIAPNALLLGNLGLTSLRGPSAVADIRHLIDMTQVDAFAIYSNALQEAVQRDGQTDFRGLAAQLASLTDSIPVPLVLKEVGHGLGVGAVKAAVDAGFAAVDVAGAGGTAWGRVEEFMRYGEVRHLAVAEMGIPTAAAIVDARRACPETTLIASGGIRSGVDAAKAIALGADAVAVALPLLGPAMTSAKAVIRWIEAFLWELRVAMHCAGARSLTDLRSLALRPTNGLLLQPTWES